MNRRTILLFGVVVGSIAIATVATTTTRKAVSAPQNHIDTSQQRSASMIDGAMNPELIPDHIAYSMLFRLIAGRETEGEKTRIRSYIRQMGLEGADVDTLITAAEEFNQRVSVLDNQAAVIKNRHFFVNAEGKPQPRGTVPTSEEHAQLDQLRRQKELVVIEIVTSLQSRLSPEGVARARQHVSGRMKRGIRMSARQAE